MNELQIFNNEEFGEIRSIIIDDEPWFVGKDVAEALGYVNTKDALSKHVDKEDKNILKGSDLRPLKNHVSKEISSTDFIYADIPNRGVTIINESGVYALVFGSKLPTAKGFKRWITSEVLPTIRKTGSYSINNNMSHTQMFIMAAKAMEEQEKKLLEHEAKLKEQEIRLINQAKTLSEIEEKIEVKPEDDALTAYDIAKAFDFYSESGLPHSSLIMAIARECHIQVTDRLIFDNEYSQSFPKNVSTGFTNVIYFKSAGQDKIVEWLEDNFDSRYQYELYKKPTHNHNVGDLKKSWFLINNKKYSVFNKHGERINHLPDYEEPTYFH